jgi:hypothetical protein
VIPTGTRRVVRLDRKNVEPWDIFFGSFWSKKSEQDLYIYAMRTQLLTEESATVILRGNSIAGTVGNEAQLARKCPIAVKLQ